MTPPVDPTPSAQAAATGAATAPTAPRPASRAAWLKQLHQWHWISSAMCLVGMILFAFTGITLNHAADIESKPALISRTAQLPDELLKRLQPAAAAEGQPSDPQAVPSKAKDEDKKAALPAPIRAWLSKTLERPIDDREAEWSRDEIYLAMPRPGGDAWVRIARDTGEVEFEDTDRGWISYLNDLHKGRHTGLAWSWFIDLFAVACLIFSITGLLILKFHAVNRPSTWPLVGLGLVIPALLALLLIH
ncbi:PepSY-associated TM helix domain-containing protein [Roseateles amylovorans]|uniref:PepSY-associated TM helix domain-containing protein n=1 Tax=Roseateles amylovorans TaxID=2978473 RepID=A0ABY6AYC4_9BURK|nr:PepSY-associated TM helix domain-containing protein [Roseateles amylovorans]UXH78176.1 PepSY-associated TM helix domain-containing protein [Roseateles amylovorans]